MSNLDQLSVPIGSKLSLTACHTVIIALPETYRSMKMRESVASPIFSCCGFDFRFQVFPGGLTEEAAEDSMASLYLVSLSGSVRVKSLKFESTVDRSEIIDHFLDNENTPVCGWDHWRPLESIATRSHALSSKPSLKVCLSFKIRVYIPSWSLGGWTPKEHDPIMTPQFREAFDSGLHTDVSFRVQNVIMNGHRLILSWKAPTISKLVEDAGQDDIIDITGVNTPEFFRSMLRFIYTDDVSIFRNLALNDLLELLTLANRFGVYKMKIVLEDYICKAHLTKDNAISLLLLADSENCYIMHEATVSLIVQHMATMVGKEGQLKDLLKSPHLLAVLMLAARDYDPDNANDEYALTTFGDIYRQLEQEGKLEQDGTRSTLKELLPDPVFSFGAA